MRRNALSGEFSPLTGSIPGGDTHHVMTVTNLRIACWWRAPLKEWALVV
jgi:hypothetical protein